jgi:predicted ATPase/DNA-binding CsgD family transcriptional regulator
MQCARTQTPNNLPALLTSFLGREHEMLQARALLERTRLLTLIGAGGIGKTRLALAAAASLLDIFADGVWLVELAALADPGLLPQLLAGVLQVQEQAGQSLLKTISMVLQAKKVLIVLDNCEHLLDACARLIETLLQACPSLHLLATSREVLGMSAETTLLVSPLSLPDGMASTSVENAMQSEAVRLFVERAIRVNPQFRLTAQNVLAVTHLCQQLDGIPLALELAAARLRLMPVEQITLRLERALGERFRLLTSGDLLAPPRHQTLRAMMDWSYSLLSTPEKILLRRLSIFAGGWTLEAAEAICADEYLPEESVPHVLGELVNKSLVLMNEEPSLAAMPRDLAVELPAHACAHATQARYGFLETVRQYAREHLQAAGEEELLQQRHLRYFLQMALQADARLRSAEQLAWLECLDREAANLRAALTSAAALPAGQDGLQLAAALWWFWALQQQFTEGLSWLEALLNQETQLDTLRATALYRTAWLAWFQEDYQRFAQLSEQSLALFRLLDDRQGIGWALSNLVELTRWQGHYERALALGDECLALLEEGGDAWTKAVTLLPLATIYRMQGQTARAITLAETSLALFRATGDRWGIAVCLMVLGRCVTHLNDNERAVALLRESLEIYRALGHRHGEAETLAALGRTLLSQGDLEQARLLFQESRKLHQEAGNIRSVAISLMTLGQAAMQAGDFAEAGRCFEESRQLSVQTDDRQRVGQALYYLSRVARFQQQTQLSQRRLLESLTIFAHLENRFQMAACLEALAGLAVLHPQHHARLQQAACWLGGAEALRQAIDAPVPETALPEYQETVSRLRSLLGEVPFAAAFAQGKRLSLEQVLAEVHTLAAIEARTAAAAPAALPMPSQEPPLEHLTPKEVEVLRLAATGLSNNEIASRLSVTAGTVKTHLSAVYSKLGVRSRTAAVHVAREHRLL